MSVEELQKLRQRGHDDLYFFAKEVLGYDRMCPNPHKELTEWLDSNDARTNLILMPRGSFKSTVVMSFVAQQLIRDPNKTILISSETQSNAVKFVGEIKGHFEGNPKLKALYGDWTNKGKIWKGNEFVVKPRTVGKKESSVTAGSLEKGTQVGMHYDIVVLDDVVSRNNINSDAQIEKTIEHYKLLLSILNPGGRIVVAGTRWGFYELYSWLTDPEGPEYEQVSTFFREAEDDHGNLLMPDVLSREFLDQQKKTQGEYIYSCNPGHAPVLMSDFTIKRIDEVKVGDEVVGFDIEGRPKLVKSTVEEVNSRLAETNKYTFKSGHQIECTPDHEWYKRPAEGTRKAYSPIELNSPLKRVVDLNYAPSDEDMLDYQWLAGMIDGEGACKYGSISIHQCEKTNLDVCTKITETLGRLGIPYKLNQNRDKPWQKNWVIGGGRDVKWKILQFGRPGKKNQIVKTIWDNPGRLVGGVRSDDPSRDKCVKIEKYKKQKVFALKTTTGNYVAWGYASKNCQYLNRPQSSSINCFKEDHIQYYEKSPEGLIYFMTVDPAISQQRGSDFTGIIVNGVDYYGNWYIQEAIADKYVPSDLINKIFELNAIYSPMMCLGMEKFALEKVLKASLLEEMDRRGISIPIRDLPTDTRQSKEMRIRGLQPFFEARKIYIKKEHIELKTQTLYYPQVKNDDLLDALKSQIKIVFASDVKPSKKEECTLTRTEKRLWDDVRSYDKIRTVKERYYDDW